ncbi:hypothetical protein AB1Y20_015949 [Prymnesium parvum]|uniref:EGF-like domain-containing protein n=1 Tax=Prymnesium parvum TaxID=97485 RepID=A0AB34K4G7_PRYPA
MAAWLLLAAAAVKRLDGLLCPPNASGAACSGRGICVGWPAEPRFPPLCVCAAGFWGESCAQRAVAFPSPPPSPARRGRRLARRAPPCARGVLLLALHAATPPPPRLGSLTARLASRLSLRLSLRVTSAASNASAALPRLHAAGGGLALLLLPHADLPAAQLRQLLASLPPRDALPPPPLLLATPHEAPSASHALAAAEAIRQLADEARLPLVDLALALRPSLRAEEPREMMLSAFLLAALRRACRLRAAPPPPPPPPPSGGVGVCFTGWLGVAVADGGASIAAHLLRPLRARVLLALTHHPNDRCASPHSCRLAARLPALLPFARVDLAPMLPLETLVATMEATPHWRRVLRAYSAGRAVRCARAAAWGNSSDGAPYACRGIYLGNTIFAPVLGSARLHVLRQLHDIRRCLGVVEADEEARGGRLYERIVHSRLEFVWLAPHPPLALLHDAAVWVPSGEDYYGGVNDRHAVLSRAAAEVYMRRWDFVVGGGVMRIDPQLRRGVVGNGIALQDENFVANVLRYFHLPLRRFPGVQYLACCSSTSGAVLSGKVTSACFSRACVHRRFPSAAAAAAANSTADAVDAAMRNATAIFGKYRSEVEVAIQHALAYSLPGARYLVQEGFEAMATCHPRKAMRKRSHREGFLALHALLKRRAFRGESDEISWLSA